MKSFFAQLPKNQDGSLLITAAICAGIMAILVGGFLSFISNEYTFNLRSHRWTQALHIAEGGVDRAVAEFNNYYITGLGGFSSSRGWYNAGGGTYWYYTSSFTNNYGENIGSMYVSVNNVGTANPYIFAYGGSPTTPRGPFIYRAVQSRLVASGRFPAALVAKQKVDMNGNNVYTDSYDSTDPAKSTGALYDPSKRFPNGDVASNDTVTNSVAIGNADIYGLAATGPNGTITMGAQGSVGPTFNSSERATTVAEAIAKGWIRNDFQVDIPDVQLPSGATSWTSLGTLNSDRTLTAGDYWVDRVSCSAKEVITITGGRVRLYVSGDFSMSAQSLLVIEPGASVEVYCGGSVTLTGNGVINNSSQPVKCQFFGLSTSTSWSVNGNGQWVGTIYAPQANMALTGGGARGDMSGAIVAKNITLNGQVQFHYDESLRTSGPTASYNVASWQSYRWTGSGWISD